MRMRIHCECTKVLNSKCHVFWHLVFYVCWRDTVKLLNGIRVSKMERYANMIVLLCKDGLVICDLLYWLAGTHIVLALDEHDEVFPNIPINIQLLHLLAENAPWKLEILLCAAKCIVNSPWPVRLNCVRHMQKVGSVPSIQSNGFAKLKHHMPLQRTLLMDVSLMPARWLLTALIPPFFLSFFLSQDGWN